MAVGYIFMKKTIHGSCGGLDLLGIKKECDCPEPCEAKLKRQAKQEQWQSDRIL
jgi:hypothetical protein